MMKHYMDQPPHYPQGGRIGVYIYLCDHPAGDKEVGGGEEDPKRVCVTRG